MPWPERHGSLVRSTQVTLAQGTVGWVGDAAPPGMANKKRNQPRLSQDAPLCRPVGPTENGTTLFTRGNPIDCKCYLLTPPNTAGWRRVSFPRNAGACPYEDRKTADFQNRNSALPGLASLQIFRSYNCRCTPGESRGRRNPHGHPVPRPRDGI